MQNDWYNPMEPSSHDLWVICHTFDIFCFILWLYTHSFWTHQLNISCMISFILFTTRIFYFILMYVREFSTKKLIWWGQLMLSFFSENYFFDHPSINTNFSIYRSRYKMNFVWFLCVQCLFLICSGFRQIPLHAPFHTRLCSSPKLPQWWDKCGSQFCKKVCACCILFRNYVFPIWFWLSSMVHQMQLMESKENCFSIFLQSPRAC